MNRIHRMGIRFLPVGPLAACVASALGIANAAHGERLAHPQGSIVVTSCADSGAGSLRAAVKDDTGGDPIDLSQLLCSQITLTSGAIHAVQDLTLRGPGSSLLTIDGNNNDRIFVEDAVGATLAIYGMTLQNGYGASVSGGCVYSLGPVVLGDAIVSDCRVVGVGGPSDSFAGGGLYVKGDFSATDSRIIDNEVSASPSRTFGGGVFATGDALFVNTTISGNTLQSAGALYPGGGGGAWAQGDLRMSYSTASGNVVVGGVGYGGGVGTMGVVAIDHSTISDNTAGFIGGLFAGYNFNLSTISDSTISGNAGNGIGGAFIYSPVAIANATIAFNLGSCGLYASVYAGVESSIIALNSDEGVSQYNVCLGKFAGRAVSGSHNLIGESTGIVLPADTISSDPMLGPLEDHGGPTFTHALLPGSPAIDTGNNTVPLDWDQRGPGFPRAIGTPDIGAFESPPADQPPVAAGDAYTAVQNTTLTVDAPGVLGNDSDPDGDALTVMLIDSPSNGVLTLNPDGSFVYVPAADFFGADGFTYEASDGQQSSQTVAVIIEVIKNSDDTIFVDGFE